jgi:hypothetical protein
MHRSSYFCVAEVLCLTSWPHYTSWPEAALLLWPVEVLTASFTVKSVTRDEQITSLRFLFQPVSLSTEKRVHTS